MAIRRALWAAAPRRASLWTGVVMVVAGALIPAASAQTLEDRVYAIARELMCPVCQGQTVAESNSALAQQMRAEIRRRLEGGQTREQILAYFVEQFGEAALAAPPRRGAGLLLWLGPVAALAAGAVVLWRVLRRWTAASRRRRPDGDAPLPPDDDVARLRREMQETDG